MMTAILKAFRRRLDYNFREVNREGDWIAARIAPIFSTNSPHADARVRGPFDLVFRTGPRTPKICPHQ
jgi:hypothetical protein